MDFKNVYNKCNKNFIVGYSVKRTISILNHFTIKFNTDWIL